MNNRLASAARPVVERLEVRQFLTVSTGSDLDDPTQAEAYSYELTASPEAGTFTATDINSTPAGSTIDLGSGSLDVVAGGMRINDFADAFHYSHQQLTGDFDIKVRITSLGATAPDAKAGIMARETLAAGSRNVFAGATPARGYSFSSRSTTGGDTTVHSKAGTPNYSTGVWVRLRRVGNNFISYRSSDGTNWRKVVEKTLSLDSTVHVGLATSARSTTQTTTARFRNLTGLTSAPPPTTINLATPTNFSAQAVTNTQVNLSWTGVSGATSYRIMRRTEGTFDVTYLTTASTTLRDTGLTPDTTYVYQVRAEGAGDPSGYTSARTATTTIAAPVAPATPTGLQVDSVTSDSATLSWTASPDATLYRIQRKAPGDVDFVDRATSTAARFTDTGLDAETAYEYRVRAEANDLSSDYTAAVQATTAAPATISAFTSTDINSTGGSTQTLTEGVDYNLTSTGVDIYGSADSFRFLHREVTGDFDVMVRIPELTRTGPKFKAGLMVRDGLNGGSRNVFSGITAGDGYRFSYRSSENGTTTNVKSGSSNFPNAYVRLRRTGNVFISYRSSDGLSWSKMGEVTLSLPSTLRLGMAVSSNAGLPPATAWFRGFRDTPPTQPPSGQATNIAWSNGVNAPYASVESLALQVGGKLFMWGGYIDGNHNVTNQGWALDLSTQTWTRLADAPLTQTHTPLASDGAFIYFAGGQVGGGGSKNIRSECFRYDIEKNTFSTFPALPEKRLGGGMVLVNNKLHYFGGNTSDRVTVSAKHWAIEIDANGNAVGNWVRHADMIHPGDHLSAVALNGKIFAVGGEHGHGIDYIQHSSVSEYDPATDTWRPLAPMSIASSHFEAGMLVVHGRIVCLGGQADNQKIIDDVRVYDPTANSWKTITDLPGTRKGGAAAFHNGTLLYTAGRGVSGGVKTIWKNTWVGTLSNPWW